MLVINTISDLRQTINAWKSAGDRIAFVPTMGNLHAGHLTLVDEARRSADRVVASIFVNPTQFGAGEDFETYPRTEAEDKQKLIMAKADLLFLPSVAEMYGDDAKTVVSVKDLSNLHCGRSRPGHFDGVATVVCKLFNMVQPNEAFFGQKDFQQLTIIQMMVKDLNIPIDIRSVATVRESDGLAMSSRNNYLSTGDRLLAAKLYQALCTARDQILSGHKPYGLIEKDAMSFLQSMGFQPDYFSVCRSADLLNASPEDTDLVVLAAAKLGKTRLIDNITVTK